MSGLAPLSYGTLAEWMRVNETELTSLEVNALMYLDGILLAAGIDEKPAAPPPVERDVAKHAKRKR